MSYDELHISSGNCRRLLQEQLACNIINTIGDLENLKRPSGMSGKTFRHVWLFNVCASLCRLCNAQNILSVGTATLNSLYQALVSAGIQSQLAAILEGAITAEATGATVQAFVFAATFFGAWETERYLGLIADCVPPSSPSPSPELSPSPPPDPLNECGIGGNTMALVNNGFTCPRCRQTATQMITTAAMMQTVMNSAQLYREQSEA